MAAFAGRPQLLFLIFILFSISCTKETKTVYTSDGDGSQQVVQSSEVVIADNSGLKKEIATIKSRLDLNESMTRLLQETVALHEQRITALEKKTTDMEAALKLVSDQQTVMQASLNDTNARIATTNQQLTSTTLSRTARKTLEDQLKALEAQQLALKAQVDQLSARTTALETFKAQQEAWNAILTENINALSRNINGLDQRMSDVEFNVSLIDQAVDELTRELLAVKSKLTLLESEQKRIINHMATDQDLYNVQQDILATLRKEILDINDQMTFAIGAINELIASKELCTAGEIFQEGGFSFVELTCGTKKLKVLASPAMPS